MTDNQHVLLSRVIDSTSLVRVWDVKGEFVQGTMRPFQQVQGSVSVVTTAALMP